MSRYSTPGAPPPVRAVRIVTRNRPRKLPIGGRRYATRKQLLALAELATWPRGTGAIAGVLQGGTLAALVQLDLAERIDTDAIGGCRYRCSAAGETLLKSIGVLIEPPQRRVN